MPFFFFFFLENIRSIVNIEFFIITFFLSGPHRLKLFHFFNLASLSLLPLLILENTQTWAKIADIPGMLHVCLLSFVEFLKIWSILCISEYSLSSEQTGFPGSSLNDGMYSLNEENPNIY